MSEIKVKLMPNIHYHIYNHGNAADNLFIEEDNYFYFLKRYAEYISPIADTYAYCLMPNHFHFIIKIKDINKDNLTGKVQIEKHIIQQFSNFFNAYTKAFNLKYKRNGRLFLQNFKRKEIDDKLYLKKAINYVHQNPLHHGFVININDWKFTSFHAINSIQNSNISKLDVIELFGGIVNFNNESILPFDNTLLLEYPY